MDQPLVSVVIPAYNAELTLARAVQSILDDTYPRKEIWIVDDGSTDETRRIAQGLVAGAEGCVHLVELSHGGANRARNRGLRESKGDYVQFLDADDWLVNDKLARSVELFYAASEQDVYLVYTGPESTNAGGLASGEFSLFTHGINTVAAVWLREFLVSSGLEWDEDLQCWQEADFFFRALVKTGGADRIRHLPGEFFVRERTTTGISSHYFSEPYILAQNLAIERIYDCCRKLPKGAVCVEGQYSTYKKSLLGRSIICGARKAWHLLAPEVRGLPVGMRWKMLSHLPYSAVRASYLVYRSLKRLTRMAK